MGAEAERAAACVFILFLRRWTVQHEFDASVNGVIRQLGSPEQLLAMSLGPVRVGPQS